MKEERFGLIDQVYGKEVFRSPVIVELLNSFSVQRLRGINQFGVPDKYFYRQNFSRLEHSLGVMLLLGHLGASEEEQIAGLIHDVSHRTFSHVYDWVAGNNREEDAQDNDHATYVLDSELGGILEEYGYDVQRLIDDDNFGLLERKMPDLCADRIDYSLRQMDLRTAEKIFKGLTVRDGQIVMADREVATIFAREFLSLQVNQWGGYEGVARYYYFSSLLGRALELGIIQESDFWKEDGWVTEKLVSSNHPEILTRLEFLEQDKMPCVGRETVLVHKKFKYIDPLFEANQELIRLSDIDEEFGHRLQTEKDRNSKGILVVKEPWIQT